MRHARVLFALTLATAPVAGAAPAPGGDKPAGPSRLFREHEEDRAPATPRRPDQPEAPAKPPVRAPGQPPAAAPPQAPRPAPDHRRPVPDVAAQHEALKLLQELFGAEYAKAETSPVAAKALAAELMRQAAEMRRRTGPDDVVSHFVLLDEAIGLAARGDDFPAALAAAEELAQTYAIDGAALKIDLVNRAARHVTDAAAAEPLIRAVFSVVDGALSAGDLPGAAASLSQAEALARRAKSVPLATEVANRRREVRDLQAQYRNLPAAIATLREDPNDPAANLIAGRFYCLVAGRWDVGLPLLARGGDAALRALATRDLQAPAAGDARAALADEWWSLGERHAGRAQSNLRGRAAHWYRQAMPQLGGLKRTLAQKRIGAAPAPPIGVPPPGPAQAEADAGNGDARPPGADARPAVGGGVVVTDPGPAAPAGPAPVEGPPESGDRLLRLLATRLPADLRPVPGGPRAPGQGPGQGQPSWDPQKTQQWLRENVRPGTPITAEVQLMHTSGLQQSPSTKKPYAYLTFRGTGTVEHAGIRHTLNLAARLEGRKANDAVQLVQGAAGRLSGTITECRLGGWNGNQDRGLSGMTFLLMVDNVQFTPTPSAE